MTGAVAALVYPGITAMFAYLLFAVWLERKLAAKVQWRYGPLYVSRRLGGILQGLADAVKLVFSELVVPSYTNRALFAALPLAVFAAEALPILFIPGAPGLAILESKYGLAYILVILLLATPAIVAMAWVEADKFTYIGALREILIEVAYEVPLALSVLSMVVLYGPDPAKAVEAQRLPGIAMNPLAFFAFFISAAMATSRFPFEIPDADTEIVFGPYTEYGSSLLLASFGANYVGLYSFSMLGALLFLGGWAPFSGALGALAMIAKALLLTTVWLFLRAVYPRMRIDQALKLGWGSLLLISAASLAVSAAWRLWLG
ncbi:MAG: NADH-quinone oxidoreductase subunit H [Thermoproteus sp.]